MTPFSSSGGGYNGDNLGRLLTALLVRPDSGFAGPAGRFAKLVAKRDIRVEKAGAKGVGYIHRVASFGGFAKASFLGCDTFTMLGNSVARGGFEPKNNAPIFLLYHR